MRHLIFRTERGSWFYAAVALAMLTVCLVMTVVDQEAPFIWAYTAITMVLALTLGIVSIIWHRRRKKTQT